MSTPRLTKIAVVAIGRNEGERLDMCLTSLKDHAGPVVYVDSGSSDGSASKASKFECSVIELDRETPFTAARARNKGFDHVRRLQPDIRYIQFIDGDCEMCKGWMEVAANFLEANPGAALVYGRRKERYPAQSIYNMLCDIEWNTPIGEAKACGGDALMRADAIVQVGGYREDVIAAEDTELCVRLRAAGWKLWRIDSDMTVHDAGMTNLGQWWRRALRTGYAFAQGSHLHGAPPERLFVRESLRACVWGLCLPLICLASGFAFGSWGLLVWLIYPMQILRLTIRNREQFPQRFWLALFQVLARFPEGFGQLKFLRDRLAGRRGPIIEYK